MNYPAAELRGIVRLKFIENKRTFPLPINVQFEKVLKYEDDHFKNLLLCVSIKNIGSNEHERKVTMKFEYKVKIFSMKDLKEKGIVVDSENNILYACRTDGACEIHDVKMEQLDNLSSVLNVMGEEGWELIQLVFHQSGIVSFWKRSIKRRQ